MPRWKVRWNQPPWVFHKMLADHALQAPQLGEPRWDLVSLCLHGNPQAGPLHTYYTSVWVERSKPVEVRVNTWPGSAQQVADFIADRKPNYQPVIVTGAKGMFTAVVKHGATPAEVVFDSPAPSGQGGSSNLPYLSRVPLWIDVWADLAGAHFTFVYRKDLAPAFPFRRIQPLPPWNALQFTRSQIDSILGAMSRGFTRPDFLCSVESSSDPLYFAVFRDEPIEGYFTCAELDEYELATTIELMKSPEWGGWPLRVHARGEPGPHQRFTLIGARYPFEHPHERLLEVQHPGLFTGPLPVNFHGSSEDDDTVGQSNPEAGPEPREASSGGSAEAKPKLTVTDPAKLHGHVKPSPFLQLDQYFINLMKKFGFRVLQVAIARGGKLAYAPAFTWAEPGYPPATPTTHMRFASVSKTMTTLGVMRIWDMLGLPLADLLSTAPGKNIADLLGYPSPTDSNFKLRSVAHLLSHTAQFPGDIALGALVPNPVFVANWLHNNPGSQPWSNASKAPWSLQTYHYTDFVMRNPGFAGTGWFTSSPPPPLPTSMTSGYSGLGMVLAADVIRKTLSPGPVFDPDNTYARLMTGYTGYQGPPFFFKRLGITRARVTNASSVIAQTDTSETRFHPSLPTLAASVREEEVTFDAVGQVVGGPLSPIAYEPRAVGWGITNGDWSMAACDVVKVISSLDIPSGQRGSLFDSPVMRAAVTTKWANNRDFVLFDLGTPVGTVANHNGGYDGTGAVVWRRTYTDGRPPLVVATFLNIDLRNWFGDPTLIGQVHAILDAIPADKWPSHDLFPAVGIVPPELS